MWPLLSLRVKRWVGSHYVLMTYTTMQTGGDGGNWCHNGWLHNFFQEGRRCCQKRRAGNPPLFSVLAVILHVFLLLSYPAWSLHSFSKFQFSSSFAMSGPCCRWVCSPSAAVPQFVSSKRFVHDFTFSIQFVQFFSCRFRLVLFAAGDALM